MKRRVDTVLVDRDLLWTTHVAARIISLAQDYVNESSLEVTLNEDAVVSAFRHPECSIYALRVDAEFYGFALVNPANLFVHERIGSLSMFYVAPSFRDGRVAYKFMKDILDRELGNYTYFHSSSISEIDDRTTRAYEALLRRLGFSYISKNYVKKGWL